MKHRIAHRRLDRTSEHLQALLSNLVTALITHEQIRTTLPKAKEARRVAERLITLSKDGSVHRRRRVARTIRDKTALQKLFGTLGPRFLTRPGGYTRIIKIDNRVGDNAPMAILELVERTPKAAPEKEPEETKDQKAGLEKSAAPKAKAEKPAKAPKAEKAAAAPKAEAKKKAEPKAKAEAKHEKPAAKKTKKKDD
jgi:large subunit ribosomal protein L17